MSNVNKIIIAARMISAEYGLKLGDLQFLDSIYEPGFSQYYFISTAIGKYYKSTLSWSFDEGGEVCQSKLIANHSKSKVKNSTK